MNMLTKVANAIATSQKASGGTYLDDARAAIEAMKEPTPGMSRYVRELHGFSDASMYRQFITAALEDKA